jgi:hypothetical protein
VSPEVNRPEASGTDHQAACGTEDKRTSWVCTQCGATKPRDEFARNSWTRSGRRHVCQGCRRTYDRERDYIRRARKCGHMPVVEEFTEADLVERHGDKCFHCGDGTFECIDHLVCVRVGGTHTRDNVVPCCLPCNRLKRRTADEKRIRAYRLRMDPAA